MDQPDRERQPDQTGPAKFQVGDLGVEDHTRLADQLQRVQWGLATDNEKCALFDELRVTFGHNSLAETLKEFNL